MTPLSLNDKSKKGLAHFSRLAPTTLKKPDNYGHLLEAIYERPWFCEPAIMMSL